MDLEELGLSVRAYNGVRHLAKVGESIDTVEQLCCFTVRTLMRQPNVGRITICEIQEKLKKVGRYLNEDSPPSSKTKWEIIILKLANIEKMLESKGFKKTV